jgi:hypothetical protein
LTSTAQALISRLATAFAKGHKPLALETRKLFISMMTALLLTGAQQTVTSATISQ